ncbi:MAG: hypothetical protein KAR24_03290 [Candidatus Pacebacteria bacterium]|nr:hypothetical protein [Candidatus Paceibacterota bacterium]
MKDRKDIADSIMEKIERESIKPKPRWEFLLKNYSIWFTGILAVVVGSVATSSIIFAIRNADWFLYRRLSDSFLIHVFKVMPFLWIGFLVLFVLIAIYQIKHTKRGYKYSLAIIVLGNIFVSMILGSVLYVFGFGHLIDVYAGRFVPSYQAIEERREEMWTQPENGLLAGIVLGTSTKDVLLQDFAGGTWNITMDKLKPVDVIILSLAQEVAVVGNVISTSTFEACAVRPWNIFGEHAPMRKARHKEMIEQGRRRWESEFFENDVPGSRNPDEFIDKVLMRGGDVLKEGLRQGGYGERNLFDLRSIECDEVASSSQESQAD